MLVVALLVVIVTLSLSYTTLRQQVVRAEVEKLYTLCRFFQQIACVTQTEQRLLIDPVAGTYSCGPYAYTLASGVCFNYMPSCYGPPSKPTNPISKPITFQHNTIIFFPDGTISSGTLYVTDADKKYMYALTAPINHISFLRIYKYGTGWTCLS